METIDITIGEHVLAVEVARTAEELRTGLMHREELDPNGGMLFAYERDQRLSFWMENTLIPLSIAFISSQGIIKEIADMKPLSRRSVVSHQSVRYALEVNQGFFEMNGIGVGDKVVFPEGFR
jgi:uncharacterized membrane protein (UPF0127 family)